jgi:hypothetical protein
VDIAPVELALSWGALVDRDPALLWFREAVKAATTEVFASASRRVVAAGGGRYKSAP